MNNLTDAYLHDVCEILAFGVKAGRLTRDEAQRAYEAFENEALWVERMCSQLPEQE